MEHNKKLTWGMIGAGAFALVAFVTLITTLSQVKYIFYYSSNLFQSIRMILVSPMIVLGVFVLVAFCVFTNRRDILTIAALGALAVTQLSFNLGGIIRFLGYAAIAVFAVVFLTDKLEQYRGQVAKLWFVPTIVCLAGGFLATIISVITGISYGRFARLPMGLLTVFFVGVLKVVGVFCISRWIMDPEAPLEMPKRTEPAQSVVSQSVIDENGKCILDEQLGYRDMAEHILLLVFTFGIWQYIWIDRTTKFFNGIAGEEQRDPVVTVLLSIFVPFYTIYWMYKTGCAVDRVAKRVGVISDIAMMSLLFAILVPIVAPILIQDKMNAMIKANKA